MREKMRVNEVVDGVMFYNLPLLVDEEGKIGYPFNSWAVAEIMANKIDPSVKPYVVIDFLKVKDKQPFLSELDGGLGTLDDDGE